MTFSHLIFQYWIDLMKETFPVAPRIRVLAYPSKKLNEDMIKNEMDRIEKQKLTLGKEGLQKAGEAVANAIKSQILPPQEVLESGSQFNHVVNCEKVPLLVVS